MERIPITAKMNRDIWLDFAIKVKRERKQIGDVLEPLLIEYTKRREIK